jgi:hypothetical protein
MVQSVFVGSGVCISPSKLPVATRCGQSVERSLVGTMRCGGKLDGIHCENLGISSSV